MDSDTALRVLAAVGQSSVALAGLMLIATTFYLGRTKRFYSRLASDADNRDSIQGLFDIFVWAFVIVIPVAYGLWTAYESFQLMLEMPVTEALSDEITAKISDRLECFRFLILYVVMDVIFFAILLPLFESKRREETKKQKI